LPEKTGKMKELGVMQLQSALEVIRRDRGPVSSIGLRQGGELCYIVETTGETLRESELISLARQLQQERDRDTCSTGY
jgi:hypothetical protein